MDKLSNSLIRISYGILFPLALLFFALTSHFQIQKQNKIEAYKSKMSDCLNLLYDYHSDAVFFHSILQKNFRIADQSFKQKQAIKSMITKFKKRFNNKISFIVWNKKGKLLQNLSDRSSYKYVLGIVFKAIGKLSKLCSKTYPPDLRSSSFLKKRIGLIRKILGRMLVVNTIYEPFGNSYLGKCVVSSSKENNGLTWYQHGKNYSIACFISRKLLFKNLPAQILTNRFNSLNKDIKLAAYDYLTQKTFGLEELKPSEKREIKIEIGKYELAAPKFKNTKQFLLLFRQASDKLLTLSYIRKTDNFKSISDEVNKIIFKVISIFISFLFVLYCYRLNHQMFYFSVKRKLIVLFLFVSFVGLFTIVATAYKFFDYRKNILINKIQNKSLQNLKDIGKKYKSQRNKIGNNLNRFIKSNNQKYIANKWPKEEIQKLKKFVNTMNPSLAFIFYKTDDKIYTIAKEQGKRISNSSIKFMSLILRLVSNQELEEKTKEVGGTSVNISNDKLLYSVLNTVGIIHRSHFIIRNRWSYIQFLGDAKNYNNWGLITVSWDFGKLQRVFLQKNMVQLNKDFSPRKLVVMTRDNEIVYPKNMRTDPEVRNTLHRAFTSSLITNNRLIINKKAYIATAISENTSLNCSLLTLYPRDIVEKEISNLKYLTFFLIIFSSILFFIISGVFSNVLIAPISDLSSGVGRIKKSNFDTKIENVTDDEIGELEELVNETMESLKMLSVGTSVQKSLLPDRRYEIDKLELFADSVFMTKMGGDYFDYFVNNQNNNLTLLFGDVSGHGIPAGMIMGSVKAIVMQASITPAHPLALLVRINKVLRDLKKRKWRGAMSCQCIEIGSKTGKMTIANAGHCFPIIVDKDGKAARYLKIMGMPLGSRMSSGTKEVEDSLKPGETLILYSDGIVEGLNAFGEPLGYARFKEFILQSWANDPKVYWNNIYALYKEWAQEQDDDITFMVITMHKD